MNTNQAARRWQLEAWLLWMRNHHTNVLTGHVSNPLMKTTRGRLSGKIGLPNSVSDLKFTSGCHDALEVPQAACALSEVIGQSHKQVITGMHCIWHISCQVTSSAPSHTTVCHTGTSSSSVVPAVLNLLILLSSTIVSLGHLLNRVRSRLSCT